MKKFILLFLCAIFLFTGCSKEGNGTTNEFKVGEESFIFDQDSEFHDFKYKNAGLEPDESQKACYLTYENKSIYDGRFVYRIVMAFQENTKYEDQEDARKDYKIVKINGITWKNYVSDTENAYVVVYATEKNNNLYIVNFMRYPNSNVDVDTLAKVFMNGVTLK